MYSGELEGRPVAVKRIHELLQQEKAVRKNPGKSLRTFERNARNFKPWATLMLSVSEWHWRCKYYIYRILFMCYVLVDYETMIATANLLSPLILRNLLPSTRDWAKIEQATCGYRALFVCPNLSPSGYYVYMLWPDAQLLTCFKTGQPILKPVNQLWNGVHAYQVLVRPAKSNLSVARSRKE